MAGYQPGGPDDPNSLPLVLNWDPSAGGFSPDDFWNTDPNQQGLPPWLIAPWDGSGGDAQPILGGDDPGRPLLPSEQNPDGNPVVNFLKDGLYLLLTGLSGTPASWTQPRNLEEQLALDEAKGGAGQEMTRLQPKDPDYPPNEWMYKSYDREVSGGGSIHIHYWENRITGQRTAFKFKPF